MTYKEVAKLIPTIQAAALVGENMKELKKKKKNLVGMGMKNIVGTSLLKANADLIGEL